MDQYVPLPSDAIFPVYRSSTASVVKTMIVGLTAAWILSFAYGPICRYDPSKFLSILITIGMGLCLGRICKLMIRSSRINGIGAAMAIGLIVGAGAVWFCWLGYIWALCGYDFSSYFYFLTTPPEVFSVMETIARDPLWTITDTPAEPVLYYCVWLAEAFIIICLTVWGPSRFAKTNLACDACGDWFAKTIDYEMFALDVADQDALYKSISQGDLAPLVALPRMRDARDETIWLEADGYACPNCRGQDYRVTVSLVTQRCDKYGKWNQTETVLARFVPVSLEMEKKLFEPSPTPPPAETQPVDAS